MSPDVRFGVEWATDAEGDAQAASAQNELSRSPESKPRRWVAGGSFTAAMVVIVVGVSVVWVMTSSPHGFLKLRIRDDKHALGSSTEQRPVRGRAVKLHLT